MTNAYVISWNIRQLMAAKGLYQTTDLVPLMAEHGVSLSREQVYRLVTSTPSRLNLEVLSILRHPGLHPQRPDHLHPGSGPIPDRAHRLR